MPGVNPLVPDFPGSFFGIFIVLFVVIAIALIGGSIAVTVVLVRRANSGEPLDLQPTDNRASLILQSQMRQSQFTQQQLMQQQAQINSNNINGL